MDPSDKPETPADKRLRVAARVSRAFQRLGYQTIQYGGATVDWQELRRIASLPVFRVESQLDALREECRTAADSVGGR